MTDYGYGLTVDWTPEEKAKIEKYRNAERSNQWRFPIGFGRGLMNDPMREILREVWDYAGFESGRDVWTIDKGCGAKIHNKWKSARDYVYSKQHTEKGRG